MLCYTLDGNIVLLYSELMSSPAVLPERWSGFPHSVKSCSYFFKEEEETDVLTYKVSLVCTRVVSHEEMPWWVNLPVIKQPQSVVPCWISKGPFTSKNRIYHIFLEQVESSPFATKIRQSFSQVHCVWLHAGKRSEVLRHFRPQCTLWAIMSGVRVPSEKQNKTKQNKTI